MVGLSLSRGTRQLFFKKFNKNSKGIDERDWNLGTTVQRPIFVLGKLDQSATISVRIIEFQFQCTGITHI